MKGGPRPGAGRPRGATTRLPAADVAARLGALRSPGETWADLARRLGVSRQAVSRAVHRGATERTVSEWERRSKEV